jgi:hypothetical protein
LITSISDDAAKVQFGIESFQYDKQTIIDWYTLFVTDFLRVNDTDSIDFAAVRL